MVVQFTFKNECSYSYGMNRGMTVRGSMTISSSSRYLDDSRSPLHKNFISNTHINNTPIAESKISCIV
ncbi:hypothetical protein EUZ93_01810 [Wolbachia pipientis]|nr:hypothetical protein [Wolbachia pipientis]